MIGLIIMMIMIMMMINCSIKQIKSALISLDKIGGLQNIGKDICDCLWVGLNLLMFPKWQNLMEQIKIFLECFESQRQFHRTFYSQDVREESLTNANIQ